MRISSSPPRGGEAMNDTSASSGGEASSSLAETPPNFRLPHQLVTLKHPTTEASFMVHKEFACYYSPVLKEAFQQGEVYEISVTWHFEPIQLLVQWLYNQRFDKQTLHEESLNALDEPPDMEVTSLVHEEQFLMGQLWTLAKHLQIPGLQNDAIDQIRRLARKYRTLSMDDEFFGILFDHATPGTALHEAVIDLYSWLLTVEKGAYREKIARGISRTPRTIVSGVLTALPEYGSKGPDYNLNYALYHVDDKGNFPANKPFELVTLRTSKNEYDESFGVHRESACHYSRVLETFLKKQAAGNRELTYIMRYSGAGKRELGSLLQWLYTQQIDRHLSYVDTPDVPYSQLPQRTILGMESDSLLLADLWYMADELKIPSLQKLTIGHLWRMAKKYRFVSSHKGFMDKLTNSGKWTVPHPLSKAVSEIHAWLLVTAEGIHRKYRSDTITTLPVMISTEVLLALAALASETKSNDNAVAALVEESRTISSAAKKRKA
ncbi:hypothetical protein G7Y89_g12075 [Cudoniella acicularis]|uniref:BTB domain-containing protein n=1 Tax=Cudoniella acicularis TaxID=354080 RepID=A0A8H4W006_9HELO|nr:hypothetical protein G7Y89_g12075 [Cudoniella acicularis]